MDTMSPIRTMTPNNNTSFPTIVIGAGSGGLTVALGLASAGKRVLMIERGLIGWDCTNYGCIPSKSLIHAEGNLASALETARTIRSHFQHEEEAETLTKKYPHLSIVSGQASFVDEHTISVGDTTYRFDRAVIATGSSARMMSIEGVPNDQILSNHTIFDTDEISQLVVVGGGFIGIEMALAFARRWVPVTQLIRSDRLGNGEADRFTESLQSTLIEAGVELMFHTSIIRGDQEYLTLSTPQGEKSIPYSHVLLALGRIPNTQDLKLDQAGIKTEKEAILTDVYSRTSIKHIFAIGDVVADNPQFTHIANHEGRGVVQSILFPYLKKKTKHYTLPSTLYDREREFTRTGMTREQACAEYGADSVQICELNMKNNDRSRTETETEGYVRLIYRRLSMRIVWAEIVSAHAGEMISLLSFAIQQKKTLRHISSLVFPYPSRSDLIKRVADIGYIDTLKHLKSDIKWYIKKRLPLIIAASIWLSVLLSFIAFKNISGKDNITLLKDIFTLLSSTAIGPILYIVIYAFRPILFFPATLLTFLSGVLFGVWWGFLATMIGENLSASVAYTIGRFFGTHIPELKKSPITLDTENTFSSILFTRFAFFPFDLVNYLSGFLRLRWAPFALATAIGIIPGALVFIIAGASLEWVEHFDLSSIEIDSSLIITSVTLFIITSALAYGLKRYKSKTN